MYPNVSTRYLFLWQAALFPAGYSGLHKIQVGRWRRKISMQVVSGSIGQERVHSQAPPSPMEREMKRFIAWWNNPSPGLDGLLRAGMAHLYFVTLHSFEDGNGRVARALTDMALSQDENLNQRFYSMSSRIMEERKSYYDVLEKPTNGGMDITLWLAWFVDCFHRTLQNSEKLISLSLLKTRFWRKFSESPLNTRQKKS